MRTKQERKTRVQQLIDEWLSQALEAIRDGQTSGVELRIRFEKFCRDGQIDRPQDKSLRDLIVSSVTRRLRLYSQLIKLIKRGSEEGK